MLIGKYYQCFHRDTNINDLMNWYRMTPIMQHRPTFQKEEAEATYKYMLEDSFITEYKKTEELENRISNYLNCKECIMTTSGTCAITLSLMALDLNQANDPVRAFQAMLESALSISEKLHASICDAKRAPLSKQMIEHLKSRAQEISHLNSMKNISA